jgi:hypothetical protein
MFFNKNTEAVWVKQADAKQINQEKSALFEAKKKAEIALVNAIDHNPTAVAPLKNEINSLELFQVNRIGSAIAMFPSSVFEILKASIKLPAEICYKTLK